MLFCYLSIFTQKHFQHFVILSFLQCHSSMKRPASLVWIESSVLNQSAYGISPDTVPHWLFSFFKCTNAKGIHLFLFLAISVLRYSKQKQQGSFLTADLSGGVCLLPGLHLSHEVIWIVTILQKTCSEAKLIGWKFCHVYLLCFILFDLG